MNYTDPFIPKLKLNIGKKKQLFKSLDLTIGTLKKHDLTIILTAHDKFNYKKIIKYSNLLIDTRFVIKKYTNNVINL